MNNKTDTMTLRILIIFLTIFFAGEIFGQSAKSSIYQNLETKKIYSVSLSFSNEKGINRYKINDKKVSESTYNKYNAYSGNMKTCTPCILKIHNEDDILIKEGVYYTDCQIGSFKDFYPNGKTKLSGQYKENNTGNWEGIYKRGLCNVADGQWTYFNEQGKILYSEFWQDGAFIKQIPEQENTEIWAVSILLKGEEIKEQTLTCSQINELIITPKFKNSQRENVNLTINVRISASGYTSYEQSFTLNSFKNMDVKKALSEIGIPTGHQIKCSIEIRNNEVLISRIQPKINY
jgi:antitoxin component YwqK of YwqJK toxin-antitoxin module